MFLKDELISFTNLSEVNLNVHDLDHNMRRGDQKGEELESNQ